MTTSKRISLLFAGYVTIVVIVFGIVVNAAFFVSWYRIIFQKPQGLKGSETMVGNNIKQDPQGDRSKSGLQDPQWFNRMARRPLMNMQKPIVVTDEAIIKELGERNRIVSLISYQDQVWHYRIVDGRALLTSVDSLIDSQLLLIYITLIAAMILAMTSYWVSMYLVQRGLQPLHDLADHVHNIQDPTQYEHLVVGPDYDELQIVSDSLTHAMLTIAVYTDRLKVFVTHASHELKTPLMTISSSVDLMVKQGVDSSQIQAIKQTTTAMKQLIDRLMMTMRDDVPQAHKLDIVQLISHTIKRSEPIHPHCQGRLIASVDEGLIKYTDLVMCESIISNLIENACKYATLETPITMIADQGKFSINNHINADMVIDLEQIWQPFYQGDASHTDIASHGLGLSIVQQYVQRLGWKIEVKREDNIIIFTIDWS